MIVREALIPHTGRKLSKRNKCEIVRMGPLRTWPVTGEMKKELWKMQDEQRSASIIKEDKEIMGVVEEVFYESTLQRLEELVEENNQGDGVVLVESVEMYEILQKWARMRSAKKKQWYVRNIRPWKRGYEQRKLQIVNREECLIILFFVKYLNAQVIQL